MTPTTAAVLAPIFPLLLIAMVADRSRINMKLRRLRWYKYVASTGYLACLLGMALAAIATANEPIHVGLAMFIWALFGLVLLSFGVSAMFTLVTHEVEEEEEEASDPVDDATDDAAKASSRRRRVRLELSWGRGE